MWPFRAKHPSHFLCFFRDDNNARLLGGVPQDPINRPLARLAWITSDVSNLPGSHHLELARKQQFA
jgi:hypothetical protein